MAVFRLIVFGNLRPLTAHIWKFAKGVPPPRRYREQRLGGPGPRSHSLT